MPEHLDHPDGRLEHPSVRSEPSDASLKWVGGLLALSLVLGVIIHLAILLFFDVEKNRLDNERRSKFPLAPVPSTVLPPEPRLEQVDRLANISAGNVYVRQQDRLDRLASYGLTGEKGYIHIPIDRAIELLANKLPARDPAMIVAGMDAARTLALLGPGTPGVLSATAALFPGSAGLERQTLDWRANGLINGGESNSGRLFNRRKPPWRGR